MISLHRVMHSTIVCRIYIVDDSIKKVKRRTSAHSQSTMFTKWISSGSMSSGPVIPNQTNYYLSNIKALFYQVKDTRFKITWLSILLFPDSWWDFVDGSSPCSLLQHDISSTVTHYCSRCSCLFSFRSILRRFRILHNMDNAARYTLLPVQLLELLSGLWNQYQKPPVHSKTNPG